MKTLLLLTLTITLVACGEKGSNSSNGEIYNRYQDALQEQKEGFVLLSTHSGTEWGIDFNDDTRLFSPVKSSFTYTDREIVLRVKGDHIYKYIEGTYGDSDYVDKRVILESIVLESKETEELLRVVKFKVVGDRLVGSFNMEGYETSYDSGDQLATISGGFNSLALSLSQTNILCDYSTISRSRGQVFTSPSMTKTLDSVTSKTIGSCPARLSIAELKKIDLTSVRFCNESKEDDEYDCDEDMDMSFLTDDL